MYMYTEYTYFDLYTYEYMDSSIHTYIHTHIHGQAPGGPPLPTSMRITATMTQHGKEAAVRLSPVWLPALRMLWERRYVCVCMYMLVSFGCECSIRT